MFNAGVLEVCFILQFILQPHWSVVDIGALVSKNQYCSYCCDYVIHDLSPTVRAASEALSSAVPLVCGGLLRNPVRIHKEELKDYIFLIITSQCCLSLFVISPRRFFVHGSLKTKAALPRVLLCRWLLRSQAQRDSIKGFLLFTKMVISTPIIIIIDCVPLNYTFMVLTISTLTTVTTADA